ncbi:MAG: protein kinase [Kofleriaceae bacterium]
MKPAVDSAPTEEFGPYVVYERLGVGGMAVVHRAKKQGIAGFERKLALKRLLPHFAEDADFIASFIREAKVASLLIHPNVAQIYDFGRIDGVYYIAMEHVDGFDVRKLLRFANKSGNHIPLGVVLSILIELCEALEYAHNFVDEHGTSHGIVHRDVSPSNLIVAHTGHLKVIDFGIAKAESRQLHTESGRVKGKLGYMSPEAAMGTVFGPVSDVFSTGVVAYELLTAAPLFSAKTDFETMLRIREAEIIPPSVKNMACPPELDEIVLAALSRTPETRTQTAGVMRAQLEAFAAMRGIRVQARDVAEWMLQFAQPEDGAWARPSAGRPGYSQPIPLPAGPPERATSNLRPRSPSGPHTPSHPQRTGQPTPPPPMQSHPQMPVYQRAPIPPGYAGAWDDPPRPASGDFSMMSPAAMPTPTPAPVPQPVVRSRAPIYVLLILMLVAGGLGGYLLYLRSTRTTTAPSTEAMLRFEIQPAGAIIEIGGKEISRRSPYDHTLDPGMYTVSVREDGYKTWTGSVTLRKGDRQTVNVALERGLAKLAVDSTPSGLAIQLDGQPTPHRTPAKIDVPSGSHRVAVVNADGKMWSQDVMAEVGGSYAVSAPFDTGSQGDEPPVKPDRIKPDRKPRIKVAGTDKVIPKEPEVVVPDAGVGSAVVKEPEVIPPVKPPPPPPPVIPPKSTRTPIVAASAVQKLSGEIPTIKVKGGSDGSQALTVKVCIDESGRVTSAKVTKATDIAVPLQNAILGWRYKPYRNKDSQLSAVCFPLQVGVVVRRAD